jgi:crotonobetainyl-CoA:carnitine CoA-transferase CaiB-like acyl-CoA transferase
MAMSLLDNHATVPAAEPVRGPDRPAPAGPLVGLRVLEMGSLVAGPFCGRLLGEFGAEVIKVEAPDAGDQLRAWGKRAEGHADSLWWYVHGRNKRCVTLNLKDPRGQELARRLALECDVLVENFRPGKLAEWGLDYPRLAAEHPGLVYVSISGFGQTGPYRDRVGFGSIAESMGGLRYLTGYPDRPPTRVGLSLGDSLAGLYAALGALMAIHHRDRNGGRGQLVDVALYEAIFSLLESAVPEYDRLAVVRERKGTRLSSTAPSNTYPTRDGHLIVIGGNNDAIFRRLMRVIGRPELADDPRFATNQDRLAHVDELDQIIGAWTAGVDRHEALRALEAADVPVGPIYSVADIFQDPHYWARQMLVRAEDERLGSVVVPGVAPKFSATPGGQSWLGPDLGADTDAVLHDLLGLGREQLDALRAAGVI